MNAIRHKALLQALSSVYNTGLEHLDRSIVLQREKLRLRLSKELRQYPGT